MPQLIERPSVTKYFKDGRTELDMIELLDTLFELEGVDGVYNRHFVTDREIAKYLLERKIIEPAEEGYRVKDETKRKHLIGEITRLEKERANQSKKEDVHF